MTTNNHPVPTSSADMLVKLLRKRGDYPSDSSDTFIPDPLCREAAARILALESQLARMGEALKPFAKLGPRMPDYIPDDALCVLTNTNGEMIDTTNRVYVGDLRRAAEALSTPAEES